MPVDGWKVKNLRQINNNVVKCLFDLERDGWTLTGFSYRTANGKSWIALPTRQRMNGIGETDNIPSIFIYPKEKKEIFLAELKKLIEKHIK